MPKHKVISLGQSHRPGQYAETNGYLPWAKPPSRAVCRNKRLSPLGKATVQGSMPKQKVTSLGQSHRPGQYAETKGYLPWAKPPSRAVCRNKRLSPLGKATVQGSMPKQKVISLSNASSAAFAALTCLGARVVRYAFPVRTLSFATPCRFIPALSVQKG